MRNMLRAAALLLAAWPALGQKADLEAESDTVQVQVYFRRGSAVLEEAFRGNGERLRAFAAMLDSLRSVPDVEIGELTVEASASPEGRSDDNAALASARLERMKGWLSEHLAMEVNNGDIHGAGIDWDLLAGRIAASEMECGEEAVKIIRETPVWVIRDGKVADGRKRQLQNLQGGEVWRRMEEGIFPDLRKCTAAVVIKRKRVTSMQEARLLPEAPGRENVGAALVPREEITAGQPQTEPAAVATPRRDGGRRRMLFALRTNVLAVPFFNVGVEAPIRNRWSVGVNYYYPWVWRKPDMKDCREFLAWDLEGRYWLGARHAPGEENWKYRLQGHSVGIYAAAGYYDFERNWFGHQGEFINVGADYLWAAPICRNRMHIELEIGIGLIYSAAQPYDVYDEGGKAYRQIGIIKRVTWLGPTRVGASLVIPVHSRKGEAAQR